MHTSVTCNVSTLTPTCPASGYNAICNEYVSIAGNQWFHVIIIAFWYYLSICCKPWNQTMRKLGCVEVWTHTYGHAILIITIHIRPRTRRNVVVEIWCWGGCGCLLQSSCSKPSLLLWKSCLSASSALSPAACCSCLLRSSCSKPVVVSVSPSLSIRAGSRHPIFRNSTKLWTRSPCAISTQQFTCEHLWQCGATG